jgi:predicted DNA binding CopG/RHH family protein
LRTKGDGSFLLQKKGDLKYRSVPFLLYFVVVEEYVHLVPHIVGKDYIFLKTGIPVARQRKRTRKSRRVKPMKYDKEEKGILDAYEQGKMKLTTPSKKETEAIKATAKKTLVKSKRITIRLYDHDYRGIQKKAMETGIPYQTLISGVIHQYIEGELQLKQDSNRVQPTGGKKRSASG